MNSETLSFTELHSYVVSAHGSNSKAAANITSALKSYVLDIGMEMSDMVGPTFRGDYYRLASEHLQRLSDDGRPVHYIANRKYFLKRCRNIVLKLDAQSARANAKETPLSTALNSLAQRVPNLSEQCRRISVPYKRLAAYMRGGTPGRGTLRILQKVENHFQMVPGTLTDLLPRHVSRPRWTAHGRRVQGSRIHPPGTSYRARLTRALKDPYLLRPEEITSTFRDTWKEYLTFKTDPWAAATTTTGKPRKLSCWRCHPFPSRVHQWSWVCEVNRQWCPTAQHYFYIASAFLGWLRKPISWGGGGLPIETAITLAWFSDMSRIKAFMTWRKAQSENIANSTVWKVLVFAASLCQPERGFLWRHSTLGRDAGYATVEEWRTHCAESYATCRQLMKIIKADIRPSRDPFEPVKDIISMARPLDAVFDAIDRMDYDRPPPDGEAERVWARNRLLLALTASNPLRARNLKELTWREDNTGSLRRDSDGNYRIYLKSAQLKNHSGAGATDYDVRVQSKLTPFIDKYLRDYLPKFSNGVTDRVFVQTVHPERKWETLNHTFRIMTRRYFENSPGFGPHAMRHIVATALIKRYGSFTAAAKVLHDFESTVRKHYGFLIGDDGARWVEDLWDSGDGQRRNR